SEVEMTARDYETTALGRVNIKLLRVDSQIKLPDGQSIANTIWTNERGESLKNQMPAMEQVSYRVPPGSPASPSDGTFDVGKNMIVTLNKPLVQGHRTREARYRVKLKERDPVKTFAAGPSQTVKPLDANSAELEVRAIRPGDEVLAAAPAQHPTDADLQ